MNYKAVFNIIGKVLLLVAALMVLPAATALIYAEYRAAVSYVSVAVLSAAIGFVLSFLKPKDSIIYAKEGLVAVALAWIAVSVIGAIPFVVSGDIPNVVDALFESVSGFTTTGATVVVVTEDLTHASLLWRALAHFVGGMGVIVFVIAVVSRSPGRSMNILRAEMPGPIVDKFVPKARDTAKILYMIYAGMTLVMTVMLLCGGMPLFDSIVHAISTAGTGGFGVKTSSIATYNDYSQWVIAVFMLLFGVNFNVYYLIIIKKFSQAVKSSELRCFLIIILVSTALIASNIYSQVGNLYTAIKNAFFQTTSYISTTGFTIADTSQWPTMSKTVLIVLMFIGGCAGSTAGGLKVSRLMIVFGKIGSELKKAVHPHKATIEKLEGKRLDEKTVTQTHSYFALYFVAFFAILLLVTFIEQFFTDFSFEANFAAVASCFNNVGPIFDNVVGYGTFANYSGLSKVLLTLAMLLGRLEIYPLLLTLAPSTWAKR